MVKWCMHYHPQEKIAWNKMEYLLAPDGMEDQRAIESYLNKFVELSSDIKYPANSDSTALGAVFKHGDMASIEEAFVAFYKQFRLYEPLPNYGNDETTVLEYIPFDDWLVDMAAARPQDLERLLEKAAMELGFTHQAMVLRDVKKWLPHSDIVSYIPESLLNKRPAALFKEFTETPQDLPLLVKVGAALAAQGPTDKHKALGDTLMRSCFFSCYAQRAPRYDDSSRETNAKGAFELIEQSPLIDDFSTLLKQVYVRIKTPTVVWDALSYCAATLENSDATPKDKIRANAMVADIIEKESSKGTRDRYSSQASHALGRIYQASTDARTHTILLDFFEKNMRSDIRFAEKTIAPLAKTSPPALGALLDRLQVGQPAPVWSEILAVLALSVDIQPACRFHVDYYGNEASQFVFSRLHGPELLNCLQAALNGVLAKDSTGGSGLENMLGALSERQWTHEQRETVRHSSWPATAVLLQLYLAGCSERSDSPELLAGALPFTQRHPLPFLRMLYPEQAPLWRSMELTILDMPLGAEQTAANNQQLMAHLFDMCSTAFSPKGADFKTCQKIIEGLELSPLDFFRSNVPTTPEPALNLPDEMFNLA